MLGSLWQRFRSFPLWGQVLLWLFFWPFLAAIFFWNWEESGPPGKFAAVLLIALPFVAGGLASRPVLLEGTSPAIEVQSSLPPVLVPNPSAPLAESTTAEPVAPPSPTLPTNIPTVIPPEPAVSNERQAAVVERVVDGDTVWVRVDQPGGRLPPNATHKIRILEIDTPETQHPSEPVECWGPEASAFAKSELQLGSTVTLLHDREDRDRYGRFLRYVWDFEGEFFNHKSVVLGHARAALYQPNDLYWPVIKPAEDEAKAAGRGLWGPPCNGER